ncbi:unnamed protein product [Acanthoscelides obtectus]|uniref:Uncharacterized protein n=1 Tax=Acanthoscelides obtectus TaxID=200917 RepID=A0A9P0Q338_ACAOB|nr:unnamed protein product [Acanthoscelides obtectus]CAK1670372.1 hypothetical protein AOBTE_LOCUS27589 [Acanthoscelides obtectus]
MVRRTTIFGNVKASLFCSASARRPEIFLLFCLGHLRWIVEKNFVDNFLGHSCCECVASFFCLPWTRDILQFVGSYCLQPHFYQTEPREKPPTRHHLGFLFWGNLRYWRSIDTFSTGDLFPNRDPFFHHRDSYVIGFEAFLAHF